MLKETDRDFRRGTTIPPIKFIERAGTSLTDTLVSGNPSGDKKCGREECFVCRGEKGGMKSCMKEGVLYLIKYEECKTRGKEIEYWGETGRDCFARGGEHLKGCREEKEDNALWKHITGEHRGEEKGDEIFSMRVEKSFKKPLARQIREGVEIEMSQATLLNSKSEWNNSRIPRIIVEEGEQQVEDRESGLGNQVEKEKQNRKIEKQKERSVRGEKRKHGVKTTLKGEGGRQEGTTPL